MVDLLAPLQIEAVQLAADAPECEPARRPVALDRAAHELDRLQGLLLDELAHVARLRDQRHIRRIAAGDGRREDGRQVPSRRRVLRVDVRIELLEVREDVLEVLLLGARRLGDDRDRPRDLRRVVALRCGAAGGARCDQDRRDRRGRHRVDTDDCHALPSVGGRRSRDRSRDRRNAAPWCRRRPPPSSPSCTRECGSKRATIVVSSPSSARRPSLLAEVLRQLADVFGDGGARVGRRGGRRSPIPALPEARPCHAAGGRPGRRSRARRPRDSPGGCRATTSRPSYSRQLRPRLERMRVERQRLVAGDDAQVAVLPLEPRLEHVHRRAADEAGDEQVDRVVVQLLRRRHLLQLALAHHRHAVAHRHRLDLVVRDVDRGHVEVVLELADLGPHLHAQLRVEVGERLVHQEGLRMAHDRPSHRDPLPLAAGERARLALEEVLEPERCARHP